MTKTEKLDLKKELKHLYAPSATKIDLVDVPTFRYAMVDSELPPGQAPTTSPDFQDAMQALYSISFTLKSMSKMRKSDPIDYTVMTLEGLWSTEGDAFDFDDSRPWRFTLMIMQPGHITPGMYEEALRQLKEKKDNPALAKLRFETFREGLCVQTMQIGPYDQEPATMARMRSFAEENGLQLHGRHHEIYLGDPRRCKPERLRTILRHPVRRVGRSQAAR